VQRSDQPDSTDVAATPPADRRSGLAQRPAMLAESDLLPEIRRYLMMRPVVFAGLIVLLVLHWLDQSAFDFTTVLLLAAIYVLIVASGGLDVARLSTTGGEKRRQERLAEDALRRAGRLQSHLEPGTASDAVMNRVMASAHEPRRAVLLAGNEVEDALRAVYRHYSEAERLAGTSNSTDLPLSFMVQELIWRGLLAPDIFDTAEPVLSLRDMALEPRAAILPQTAGDCARAAQAIVLRIESLGIQIHPRRMPLAWLKQEPEGVQPQRPAADVEDQFQNPSDASPVDPELDSADDDPEVDLESIAPQRDSNGVRSERGAGERSRQPKPSVSVEPGPEDLPLE
jgi:hypothetical protein